MPQPPFLPMRVSMGMPPSDNMATYLYTDRLLISNFCANSCAFTVSSAAKSVDIIPTRTGICIFCLPCHYKIFANMLSTITQNLSEKLLSVPAVWLIDLLKYKHKNKRRKLHGGRR